MPRKSSGDKESQRQRFIRGETDLWNAGFYGFTARCRVKDGRLVVQLTQPTRQERSLVGESGRPKPDTRENRDELTRIALGLVYQWQTHVPGASAAQGERRGADLDAGAEATKGPVLTTDLVWDLYI